MRKSLGSTKPMGAMKVKAAIPRCSGTLILQVGSLALLSGWGAPPARL